MEKKITKLKRVMMSSGITQKELMDRTKIAFKVPVKQDRISLIANGKLKNISLNTLCKLAYCLEVSPDKIIDSDILNSEFVDELRPK